MYSVGQTHPVIQAFNSQGENLYQSAIASQCQRCIEESIRSFPQYRYSSLNGESQNLVIVLIDADLSLDPLNQRIILLVKERKEMSHDFGTALSKFNGNSSEIKSRLDEFNDKIDTEIDRQLLHMSQACSFTSTSFAVFQTYRYGVKYGQLHADVRKVKIILNPYIDPRINYILQAAVANINKEQEEATEGFSGFIRSWNPFA